MQDFKTVKEAIVAISFSDETYQVYSGAIFEIEVYREDENIHYLPASVNNEMIIKLHFPQGFTINYYDQNIGHFLLETN